jgi:hypothetical protein
MATSPPNPLPNDPKAALLLACARAGSRPAEAEDLARLAETVDWGRLLNLAGRHGLRPLLYHHLQEAIPDKVPPEFLDGLREEFQANARRNLLMTSELLRILALLRECGIPAIPYKGPILTATLYGNLALREFFDLDILVPAPQAVAAKQALVSAGYQPVLNLTPRQEAAVLRSGCEFEMEDPERRLPVEIHWQIVSRHLSLSFDTGGLFARARAVRLGGADVPTLAPEDLLLVLSVHAAKHLWQSLSWICDLNELLHRHPELDWPRVQAQAKELGAERILRISLYLARELLGCELPAGIAQEIAADTRVAPLGRELMAWMWPLSGTAYPTTGQSIRLLLRARERWRDKVRYVWRILLLPGMSGRMARLAGRLARGLGLHSASVSPTAAELNQSAPPPRS